MPLIDQVVETFETFDPPKCVDLVITDGDDTLFPHESPEPYIDSLEYLKSLHAAQVLLVSGNPNESLAQERAESIGASAYFIPPKRPRWLKYGLFIAACNYALVHSDSVDDAVIMGNRWCMDIAVAKLALVTKKIATVEGVLVTRDSTHRETFDRILIDPVQYVGASAVKSVGLDVHFRPRKNVASILEKDK